MELRTFRASDRAAVIDLWDRCGLLRPWNDPDLDIDRKVGHDPDGFIVGEVDGRILASAMFGYDGHRGSVGSLAVDPAVQGRGLGRRIMAAIEERLVAIGCPKVNLLVRTSNVDVAEFYRRLGYEPDETVSLGKRLIVDGPRTDLPLAGRRFPGGSRVIERWENVLLTEATGLAPLGGGLAHPIHLFHVPIEGAGTSIAGLFELAGAEGADRVGLQEYDWEWFEPLREDVAYRCDGSVVSFERVVSTPPHDVMVFEIVLAVDGRTVARVTNTWQIWRSMP